MIKDKWDENFGPTSEEDLSTPEAVVASLARSQYRKVALIVKLIRHHRDEAYLEGYRAAILLPREQQPDDMYIRGYNAAVQDAHVFTYECHKCKTREESDRVRQLAGRTMTELVTAGFTQESRKYRIVKSPDGQRIELTHEQFQEFRGLSK